MLSEEEMLKKLLRESLRSHIDGMNRGPWSGRIPRNSLTDEEIDRIIEQRKNELLNESKEKNKDEDKED